MLLGLENEGKLVGLLVRQFEQIRKRQANLLDHGWPAIGLYHESRHIGAGREPNLGFRIPASVDREGAGHAPKIGRRVLEVNP